MPVIENSFSDSFEHIQKVFSYEPYFDDPQKLVDGIIKGVESYLHSDNIAPRIQSAYNLARKAHGEQKRLSGELYIIHPLKAAEILLQIHPDIQTLQACILHDVIEDTPLGYEDVEAKFGKEVADLCEGVTKVSNVRYGNDENQLETLKKTFLAMAKDLRVIFIKIADRIHNIQTLHFHPEQHKQHKIALETMKIFVPIAKRLGLFRYALYLENGSFKILEPDTYQEILLYFKNKYKNSQKHIKEGQEMLRGLLEKEGIHVQKIKARLKSPYRIYTKLDKKYKTMNFDKVLDILAFRVIVANISECYTTLGLIHSQRRPIIHKIKDYIAIPKFNNYQSLHTTILGMFPFSVEIQIRTQEMDDIAEYGVAAHFLYAEKKSNKQLTQRQSERMKKLQESVSSYTSFSSQKNKEKFKDNLNIEFLHRNIFVYTPEGDVIELPKGSTVLDFAFRVHTSVGLKFKNALVNGTIKPINYQPSTGSVIKINIFRNKYTATKFRLDFLQTPSAKSKLKRFLKDQHKDQYIQKGEKTLNNVLSMYNLPKLSDPDNKIQTFYKQQTLNKKLIEIVDKQISPTDLIKEAYPVYWKEFHQKKEQAKIAKEKMKKVEAENTVIIDENKMLSYTICPLCDPTAKDKIIARTGRDGLKIHTVNCRAIKTVNFDKLMEAHRLGQKANVYDIVITVVSEDSSYNVASLLGVFHSLHIGVENISLKKIDTGGFKIILHIPYANPARCSLLLEELNKYKNFLYVADKDIK